jgi:hypothetical protein
MKKNPFFYSFFLVWFIWKKGEKSTTDHSTNRVKIHKILFIMFSVLNLHYVAIQLCTLLDERSQYSRNRHRFPHEWHSDLKIFQASLLYLEHLLIEKNTNKKLRINFFCSFFVRRRIP